VAGGREHLVERAADGAAHRAGTPLSLVREVDPAELHGDHDEDDERRHDPHDPPIHALQGSGGPVDNLRIG
jgi:hypothetical protein